MKYYLFVAILVAIIFEGNSFEDDPYGLGSKFSELATKNNLNFISKQITKTVNNHTLQIFGLTRLKQSNKFQDYLGVPAVFLSCFFHARELGSIEFYQQMIEQLSNQSQTNPHIDLLLKKSIVILMPYINIDSVLYVQSILKEGKAKEKIIQYRKNMNFEDYRPNTCHQMYMKGVDINRNFDFNYGMLQTSRDLCGEEYHGKKPFSQKQSQAIKYLYENFDIKLAIDIHSYGDVWIHPFASLQSDSEFKIHELYPIYQQIFTILTQSNARYAGGFQQLKYLADGTYIDWALDQGAISFALQIGKDFFELGSKSITKQYIQSFINVLKIMTNNFKYSQSNSSLCIDSYSLLSHSLTIKGNNNFESHINLKPQQKNRCISLNGSSDTYKVSVDDSHLFDELKLGQIKDTKETNKEYKGDSSLSYYEILQKSLLAKIVLGVCLLYCIGSICGLSIFCQEAVGIKNFEEEKRKLKVMTEEDDKTDYQNEEIQLNETSANQKGHNREMQKENYQSYQ